MRKSLLALALIAGTAACLPALAALGAPTEAVETTTLATRLPANAQGAIVATLCPGCAPSVLRLTAKSHFLIGTTTVSLEELRSYVASGGPHNLVIIYDRRLHTVIRIVVSGSPPAIRR